MSEKMRAGSGAMSEPRPCPFCGGEMRGRKYDEGFYHAALGPDFEWDPEYEIEHVDRLAADKVKCPLEMAAYLSEAEAIEAYNMRAERTCHNVSDDPCWYECSSCGYTYSIDYLEDGIGLPNYCPMCGARAERGDA